MRGIFCISGMALVIPFPGVGQIDADVATCLHALGIPPNHGAVIEQRPFYVPKDGKGRPVWELLTG